MLYDQHTVNTPEGVPLFQDTAGIGSRFAALALDTVIQTMLVAALTAGFAAMNALPDFGSGFRAAIGDWVGAVFVLALFLVVWGYFPACESLWRGQTPGKRCLRLRVVKADGLPVTFFDTLVRNLLRLVDFLPAFYCVGLTVMFAGRNRRLGDLAAGTVVIRERRPVAPWLMGSEEALVRRFLARRRQLAPEHRRRLAARIAEAVSVRSGMEPAGHEDAERFLERVARSRRGEP